MTQVILHVDDLALHLNEIIPDRNHFILVSTDPVDVIPVAIQSILMFGQLPIILHVALFVVVSHEPQSYLHLFYLGNQETVIYLHLAQFDLQTIILGITSILPSIK